MEPVPGTLLIVEVVFFLFFFIFFYDLAYLEVVKEPL